MKSSVIVAGLFLLSGVAAVSMLAVDRGTASTVDNPVSVTPDSEVTLGVPDMHCEFACAPTVRKTLEGLPGVETVKTDIDAKTATVTTTADFDVKQAIAALNEAGYPAKVN